MASFVLAGFVHTATGFGSALVGMPLLAIAFGVPVSAPLMALLSQIVNVVVLYQNWHALHFREAVRLTVASMFGIPFGLLLLKFGNETLITGALGILLLAYGLYGLFIERRFAPPDEDAASQPGDSERPESWSWRIAGISAGLLAGVLGGAYNANGPPVIIYGALRHWSKERFKSVLQAFFIANGLLIVAGHAVSGLITLEVLRLCLYGLPAIIIGMYFGYQADKRLHAARFRGVVLIMIIALGAMLLFL